MGGVYFRQDGKALSFSSSELNWQVWEHTALTFQCTFSLSTSSLRSFALMRFRFLLTGLVGKLQVETPNGEGGRVD